MRNVCRRSVVAQNPTTGILLLLTMCFTLCGAMACLGIGDPPKTWTGMITKGNEALKGGDNATAETDFKEAEQMCEKQFGKYDGRRATCLAYLAEMYRDEQEYRKAALAYKELIAVKEKADPNGQDLATFREQYSEIQGKLKEYGIQLDPNAPEQKHHRADANKEKEQDKDKDGISSKKSKKAHKDE